MSWRIASLSLVKVDGARRFCGVSSVPRNKSFSKAAPPLEQARALYSTTNWTFMTLYGLCCHVIHSQIESRSAWHCYYFRGNKVKCHEAHRWFLILFVKKSFQDWTVVTLPLHSAAFKRGFHIVIKQEQKKKWHKVWKPITEIVRDIVRQLFGGEPDTLTCFM